MLETKLMDGKTDAEIAKQFGVSIDTTRRALSLAAKGNLLVDFEDRLHQELLPAAHQAVLAALAEGNAKIGLEILKGTGVLKTQHLKTQAQQVEDDALGAYILSKRAHTALEEATIDADLFDAPDRPALPPSAAGVDADFLTTQVGFQPVSTTGTASGSPDRDPADETPRYSGSGDAP